MSDGENGKQLSIGAVFVLVFLLVAFFGWGFLAGSYTGAHEPTMSEQIEKSMAKSGPMPPPPSRTRSSGRFLGNAIEQLPNMTTIVAWHFKNRVWLPILILVLEVGVVFGGIYMRRLDRELSKPYQVKHRKR